MTKDQASVGLVGFLSLFSKSQKTLAACSKQYE